MAWWRDMRRRMKGAVAPLLLLSLVGYFLWQAAEGERGLRADAQRQQDLRAARAELDRARAELAAWERRVAALRESRLDRDVLDERARAMLNLSDPREVIVPYGPGQRLF